MIDFASLNRAALRHCPDLLETLLSGGRLIGNEWTCSDVSGGSGKSCRVNITTGRWADFAEDTRGGDLVSLVAAVDGVSQGDAAQRLAKMIGQPTEKAASPAAKPEPVPIMPVPNGVAPPDMRHPYHGDPDEIYSYKDQEGCLLCFVTRFIKEEIDMHGKHNKEMPVRIYTNHG